MATRRRSKGQGRGGSSDAGRRTASGRRRRGGGNGDGSSHQPRDYDDFPINRDRGLNRWRPLRVAAFDVAGEPSPIRAYTIVLKSSSRQSEVTIHDPVRALTGRAFGINTWRDDGFRGDPPLSGERSDFVINSVVLRHERTLEHMIHRLVVIVDGGSQLLTILVHKQEGR